MANSPDYSHPILSVRMTRIFPNFRLTIYVSNNRGNAFPQPRANPDHQFNCLPSSLPLALYNDDPYGTPLAMVSIPKTFYKDLREAVHCHWNIPVGLFGHLKALHLLIIPLRIFVKRCRFRSDSWLIVSGSSKYFLSKTLSIFFSENFDEQHNKSKVKE